MRKTLAMFTLVLGFTPVAYADFLGLELGSNKYNQAVSHMIREVDNSVAGRKTKSFKVGKAKYTLTITEGSQEAATQVIATLEEGYLKIQQQVTALKGSQAELEEKLAQVKALFQDFDPAIADAAIEGTTSNLTKLLERNFRESKSPLIRYSSVKAALKSQPITMETVNAEEGTYVLHLGDDLHVSLTIEAVPAKVAPAVEDEAAPAEGDDQ